MSVPAYKKEAKERAMRAIALRNKLEKLDKLSRTEGKDANLARRKYEHIINTIPYIGQIYTAKLETKKDKKEKK